MFAVNRAALSETGPPAQKDAGRDPELEDLGLVSPGSMLNQSDAPPTWEDFTQRLQDQKTDDTATSPGEKRKQANKENKPEHSKVALKRKKSGLPEDVPDEGPEAAKKDEGSAAAPAPSPSKSDPIPAKPAAATTTQEEQWHKHAVSLFYRAALNIGEAFLP
ncbi:TPA: hypothetical protein ACH3X1_013670 [Trebouxia sp. C0004]